MSIAQSRSSLNQWMIAIDLWSSLYRWTIAIHLWSSLNQWVAATQWWSSLIQCHWMNDRHQIANTPDTIHYSWDTTKHTVYKQVKNVRYNERKQLKTTHHNHCKKLNTARDSSCEQWVVTERTNWNPSRPEWPSSPLEFFLVFVL